MATILGISGSLRIGSFNTTLLRAAQAMIPEGFQFTIGTIEGIPLYDGDLEASGFPPAVTALKDAIAAADGLLLATPEYNNAIPGVFKNAIDWLSRPAADIPRVFRGKPTAIIGASPSGFGTVLSQAAWLPVMRFLGVDLWSGRLLVSRANGVFDGFGGITDAAVKEQLRTFVSGFAAYAGSRRRI